MGYDPSMTNEERLDQAVRLIRDLEDLRTEEPEVPPVRDRLLARGMDFGFAVAAVVAILVVGDVLTAVIWGNREFDEYKNPGPGEVGLFVALIAACLAAIGWNEVVGTGAYRQSLGKRLMGIHLVVGDTRGIPRFGHRLGRACTLLAAVAITFTVWPALAIAVPATSLRIVFAAAAAACAIPFAGREGRGLHDRICGTRLVRPR